MEERTYGKGKGGNSLRRGKTRKKTIGKSKINKYIDLADLLCKMTNYKTKGLNAKEVSDPIPKTRDYGAWRWTWLKSTKVCLMPHTNASERRVQGKTRCATYWRLRQRPINFGQGLQYFA